MNVMVSFGNTILNISFLQLLNILRLVNDKSCKFFGIIIWIILSILNKNVMEDLVIYFVIVQTIGLSEISENSRLGCWPFPSS